MKIYLADLVYDTVKTNITIPLNIGCLTAVLKQKFGNDVEISLFKYPTLLEKALKNDPPDVIGLTHYSWNARLGFLFLDMARKYNNNIVTVMGGPNVRLDNLSLKKYLANHQQLDYYIPLEGEEPFANLVGELLGNNTCPAPLGCATLREGELVYLPVDFVNKPKELNFPSPYLMGCLDQFLSDPNMIPLLESNRGCPFKCIYCSWWVAGRSKIRLKPLDLFFEEIDYVSKKSIGHAYWIVCDGNFGILPRDIDIAKKFRKIMDNTGLPSRLELYHSKNSSKRNIEITEIIGNFANGYIAVQSLDPEVLKHSGRANIKISEFQKLLQYYKGKNIKVQTDVLIGLPKETANSHLNTLIQTFDLGFDEIHTINIRMLPGTQYETDEYRTRYGVKTKYRPIFGAYGIYGGKKIFELEESIRATDAMSEMEMDNFKVLHWLIYFAWNSGTFKPILNFSKWYNLNPAHILYELSCTLNPALKSVFDEMKKQSLSEWFESEEAMIKFYEEDNNFYDLQDNFMKLIFYYTALIYQTPEILQNLQDELIQIIESKLVGRKDYNNGTIIKLKELSSKIVCTDLLQDEMEVIIDYPGKMAAIAFLNEAFYPLESVKLEITRKKEYVSFCKFHLMDQGKPNLSIANLVKFLEIGGLSTLTNQVRIISS